MKNIDEINDNINELILQKSFDKLTVEEKEKALAYAGTEEEYTSLRSTLLAITTSFSIEEEVSVDQDLKSDLLNQFEKKFGSSGNRVKIIPLYRKPFFQLAVAASVTLLVFFSLSYLNPSQEKQGQLAMNNNSSKENSVAPDGTIEETVMKDLSVSHESTATKTDQAEAENLGEKGPLEEKVLETEPGKSVNTRTPILDESHGDDLLAKDEEKNEAAKEKDLIVADSKAKPNNNNTNTEALYDKVMRERKEKEAEKKKSKDTERSEDLANVNVSQKTVGKKMDADKMLESAAGSVNEAYSPAPASVIISTNVSTFVQENKTEIIDLLFTTF